MTNHSTDNWPRRQNWNWIWPIPASTTYVFCESYTRFSGLESVTWAYRPTDSTALLHIWYVFLLYKLLWLFLLLVQIYSTTEAKGNEEETETETETKTKTEEQVAVLSQGTQHFYCGWIMWWSMWLLFGRFCMVVWERILVIIWRFWMDMWCLKGLFVPVSHWSFFEWGTSKFFNFLFVFFIIPTCKG